MRKARRGVGGCGGLPLQFGRIEACVMLRVSAVEALGYHSYIIFFVIPDKPEICASLTSSVPEP